MKRLLLGLLLLLSFTTLISSSFAATQSSSDAKDVVLKLITAINNQDWNAYVSLQSMENKATYLSFFSNADNKLNQVGLFNIKSAQLKEIKEITPQSIAMYANITGYQEKYSELAVFLTGIDCTISQEDKYHFNGINYRLIILGKEFEQWYILEMSDAPIESLLSLGLGFGNNSERTALQTKSKLMNLSGYTTYSDHTRPSIIRVYRESLKKVESVDFYEYCKNVLPNEWISSWYTSYPDAVRAGAEAVKMYGWYHVYHPKWSSLGADVKDTTSDQVYKPGTATDNTTQAINDVGGIGLQNSSGYVFESQYYAGTSGSAGTKNSGKMTQYGTVYLDDHGYTWKEMCNYYYDYSDKSTDKISFFTY